MKESSAFLRTLGKAERRVRQMAIRAKRVRELCESGNMESAYEQALKLEEEAERTVLLTRALPVYTGRPRAKLEVDEITARYMPVDIGFTKESWFSVRILSLLPKKAEGSADYIRSFLYPALHDFFLYQEPVRYSDCVLIYRHVYDRRRPLRQKRDHDNIETNMVTDIIALYVMADDGPEVCSHYYCSAESFEDRTEVYILPKEDFSQWLAKEKKMPEEGVMLYEKPHF